MSFALAGLLLAVAAFMALKLETPEHLMSANKASE